eukprot:3777318-Rhodomonas_salina.2
MAPRACVWGESGAEGGGAGNALGELNFHKDSEGNAKTRSGHVLASVKSNTRNRIAGTDCTAHVVPCC